MGRLLSANTFCQTSLLPYPFNARVAVPGAEIIESAGHLSLAAWGGTSVRGAEIASESYTWRVVTKPCHGWVTALIAVGNHKAGL